MIREKTKNGHQCFLYGKICSYGVFPARNEIYESHFNSSSLAWNEMLSRNSTFCSTNGIVEVKFASSLSWFYFSDTKDRSVMTF